MLNIPGPSSRYCDGVTRRSFLKVGTLSLGATTLTLADVYRAEAAQGRSSNKSIINIYLGGGPAHQDMWEIKTEAPREIRGEFRPIATNVTGIQICEVFSRIARIMDKCVVIRSVTGCVDRHDAIQCATGWPHNSLANMGGRPSIGAVLSKLKGPADPSVPAFIGLAAPTQHRPWADPGQAGFLGPSYNAFRPEGEGMADLRLSGVNAERLGDRRRLLNSFNTLRHDIDNSGMLNSIDANTERALGVLTSSKLLNALDLSKEPQSVRERYGDGKPYQFQFDGAPTVNDQFLMARRLVEAGARCVSLTFGRWDSHGQTFNFMRDHGGKLDQCLSALIEDLDQRGMLNDVTVIAWGEFGRTPRINNGAGRDHWAPVAGCFMAGGGMRTGQAIGTTDRQGGYAATRPVYHGEIHATLYHNLGIDIHSTFLTDPTGRPQHLTDNVAMRELV
jgi:hypothetical protein